MNEKMWDFLIRHYEEKELVKLSMKDLLEVAWWFYNNPINEKRIEEIFIENNAVFKEL